MLDLVNNPMFLYPLLIIGALANFVTLPAGIKNLVKKALGAAWCGLAVFATYALYSEGLKKMGAATGAAASQTYIQWIIILLIFSIVMVGFFIHGMYGVTGQYDEQDA